VVSFHQVSPPKPCIHCPIRATYPAHFSTDPKLRCRQYYCASQNITTTKTTFFEDMKFLVSRNFMSSDQHCAYVSHFPYVSDIFPPPFSSCNINNKILGVEYVLGRHALCISGAALLSLAASHIRIFSSVLGYYNVFLHTRMWDQLL
jgi:hypothetical protein